MRVLALDTSTEVCTAALLVDAEVRERYEFAPRQHSKLILPMLQSLLEEANYSLSQIDVIAFGCGPGAFTGVRLGVSVAQGIALGADLPVVPVSTLASLAQGAVRQFKSSTILSILDARMDEIYWAQYQCAGDIVGASQSLVTLAGDEKVTRPEVCQLPSARDWLGVGSGWDRYHSVLTGRDPQATLNWQADCFPHAQDVAVLAQADYANGYSLSAEEALPVYIRNNVAKKSS